MSISKIIKKYGSVKLNFIEMYKHRAFYRSNDGDIILNCIVEYRDTIKSIESLSNLIQFECVHLRINGDLTIIND